MRGEERSLQRGRNKLQRGMGGGVGTVGTFNDRELQVMAGNAPYLTPPPHLIPSHEITPAASPLIFSYRRRAPLFRLTSHCTSTRDSYLRTLLVRPNYYASRTQFRPCQGEEGDNVPLGLHAYALRLRGMGSKHEFIPVSTRCLPVSFRTFRIILHQFWKFNSLERCIINIINRMIDVKFS